MRLSADRRRCQVRSKTDWNQTALHYAAVHSTDKRNARLFLEAGADLNAIDRDGRALLAFVPIPSDLEMPNISWTVAHIYDIKLGEGGEEESL